MAIKNQNKIFVAGSGGMVGSSLIRGLEKLGSNNILSKTRSELDLTNQSAVKDFFEREQPDQVYLAAAKVGGIHANNTYPADFIYQNLIIEANIIHESWRAGVKRLLFLGSSCIYPKYAKQPITEDSLLSGPLELTNEAYSIAKIAGIKLCESYNRQYDAVDFRCVMPTNLYGPGDNYHPENSHVIPGLIRRFHEAKESDSPSVEVWGSGTPRREFLYVDDMASASIHVMGLERKQYRQAVNERESILNVGYGSDFSISDVAKNIALIVGYEGEIRFNSEKPDGPPQKLLDCTKLKKSGWKPSTTFEAGLKLAYADFLQNLLNLRS